MAFVSVTRLRLRSLRFMPWFFIDASRTVSQTRRAEGYLAGSVLADRRWTFWTMTVWGEQSDMRRYMTAGAHAKAMPKLMTWCDEASVVHWVQENAVAPGWEEAALRMKVEGRPSKVHYPSARHRELRFEVPRTVAGVSIRPLGMEGRRQP